MAIQRGVYRKMTDKQLKTLRSKKVLEIEKIKHLDGLFAMRDKKRLADQISAIDSERASRILQIKMF
jgi:signal-transduction protein with cAMP-binding, CBS, and nucleotidyltransferase domain